MLIKVDRTKSINGLKSCLAEVLSDKNVKGVMILACDKNDYQAKEVDPILQGLNLPVFGGIFPEIIYGNEKLSTGVIVAGLLEEPDVTVIPDLSDDSADYEKLIDERLSADKFPVTMFVFVDGLSKRISALIEALFNIFGLEINYIGGGAGSLSFEQKPCLFTNEGLLMDSSLLVSTKIESGIGVKHGWEMIKGPFTVTESIRNKIISLDWKPAFDVYREIVEEHSGKKFTDDNFFDIAKSYPFGIHKLDTENIVRDPLMRGDGKSLICVGEVPENSIIDILNGNRDSLVTAAKDAVKTAEETFISGKKSIKTTLFIDCISRVLFLEEAFQNELEAVFDPDITMIGALTLGEIANSGKDYLEFYNKTAVVAVLDQ